MLRDGEPAQPLESLPDTEGLVELRETLLDLIRDPKQRDLTLRQLGILMVLSSTPGPHTVRGLAAHLGILKAAVTRALDVLEDAGLARRVPDPSDRRSVRAEATPPGAEMAQRLSRGIGTH